LSIAIAGYLVSTDASYENIVVTNEHVDYAVSLYKELYDNSTFRLREYVEHERVFNTIDEAGIKRLQEIYTKAPTLLMMLEQEAKISRNALMTLVGIDIASYNSLVNLLIQGYFIKLTANDILPTERFRLVWLGLIVELICLE
jgi:hypothetical protein